MGFNNKGMCIRFSMIFSCLLLLLSIEGNAQNREGKFAETSGFEKELSSLSLLKASPVKAKTFSFTFEGTSLKDALQEVAEQGGMKLLFNHSLLPGNHEKKISMQFRKVRLFEAFKQLLEGTSLDYMLAGNEYIIIIPKVEPPKVQIQQERITGTVTDAQSGEMLPGVNVIVKGTTIGTATGSDGTYELQVPSLQDTLVFSFIGFQTQQIPINGRSVINVKMQPQAIAGEELVVVGYGEQVKKDLTGAVSSVGTEELTNVPVSNIEAALLGQSSGVRVTSNSGAPGSRIQVRIRGGNSMIGGNEPLYVVDGFPVTGGINFLNPSDIKSITILKDASATAIYGSRGANGVVIITSKSGKIGQPSRISVSSYYGIQQVANRYDVLNAKQYAIVANEWLKNSGSEPFFNLDEVKNPGTDWQDVIFRSAPVQSHTITFSNSTDKTNYSFSGNYYSQEGIIINSGVQKGSIRLNLNHEIKSWLDLAVNLHLSRREKLAVPVNNGHRGNTMYSGALSAPPTLPVYNENGLPTRIHQIYSFGSIDMRNPLLWSKPYKDRRLTNSILQSTSLEVKLTENLSFKTLIGLEYENVAHDSYSPIIYENDIGSAYAGHSSQNSFLNENTLTYSKDFNNSHSLELLGGFTYQTNKNKYTNVSVSDFANNNTLNYDLSAAGVVNPPGSGISEWTLVSGLGRANYSIKNKYYVTATIRADGSSRFGKNNKWGIFPSGALAWRISGEPFMENVNFISNLKLRISYGITGNTALSPYQSLARLSSVRYIYEGHTEKVGYASASLPNNNLKWETTAQLDIGFNLAMFNNRLRVTVDYYKKNTTNLLASVPLPPSVGFSSVLRNIGEIQNTGVEFSVDANILTQKLKWTVSAQASMNKNKVIKLAGDSDIIPTGFVSGLPGYNIAREGEPLGSFYGYIEDGLDQEGFIKYVDTNADGVIDPLDRVILGSPYPDVYYGFTSTFSYKNFDLNIFLQGVYGNEIFWRTAYTNLNSFQRGQNQLVDLMGNYWTEENPDPNAKYPKISKFTQMRPSNRFIEDGSYLRLKSLQLAYNIPVKRMGMLGVSKARVYLKGINLFTLTNYSGLDPEVNTRGGSGLVKGTAQSAYPNAKIYSVGIQLSF